MCWIVKGGNEMDVLTRDGVVIEIGSVAMEVGIESTKILMCRTL